MARPKEQTTGVSQAFQEKCDHEQEKLQQRLARQLRSDMITMLEECNHADLTLLFPVDTLQVHSAILKARLPLLYTNLLKSPSPGSHKVDVRDVEAFKRVIKDVYTTDNLNEASQLVIQWIAQGSTSPNKENIPTQVLLDANGNHKDLGQPVGQPLNRDPVKPKGHPSTSQGQVSKRSEGHQAKAGPDVVISDGVTCPSVTEIYSRSGTPECCPLGTDLVRMLLLGADADVTVMVQGKNFKAHRAVLCARSTYFAAMLGGGWWESNTDIILLEGVSAAAMEQALLYMYGGVAELSSSCDVGELVKVADMYAIHGLRDIAVYVIKRDYCHFFHKPCSGCLVGVCETLQLTLTFGLADLMERCVKWSTKHFVRLWPTKSFACLPPEALETCCSAASDEIASHNIIDIILDTDRLMGIIPQVRWAEPVVAMTTRLMDTCVNHLSNNLVAVVETEKFRSLGTTMALGLDFLEGVFGRAIMAMPVACACQTYLSARQLDHLTNDELCQWSEDFKKLVHSMYKHCEQYMHQYINLVVGTDDWGLLPEDIQTHIKEGAWYVSATEGKFQKPPHTKSHAKGGGISRRPVQLPAKKRPQGQGGRSSNSPSPPSSTASSGAETPNSPPSTGKKSPKASDQNIAKPSTSTEGLTAAQPSATAAKSPAAAGPSKAAKTKRGGPPERLPNLKEKKASASGSTLLVNKKALNSKSPSKNVNNGLLATLKVPSTGRVRQERVEKNRAGLSEVRRKDGRPTKVGETTAKSGMIKDSKKVVNLAKAKSTGGGSSRESSSKLSMPKAERSSLNRSAVGGQSSTKKVNNFLQPAKFGSNKTSKKPTVAQPSKCLGISIAKSETNSSGSSPSSSPRSAGHASKLPKYNGKIEASNKFNAYSGKNNEAVFAKCRSMHIASMKERRFFDRDIDEESVISSLSHVAVRGSAASSVCDLSPSDLGSEVQSDTFSERKSSRSVSPERQSCDLPGLDEGYVSNQIRSEVILSEIHLPVPQEYAVQIIPFYDVIFSFPKKTLEM